MTTPLIMGTEYTTVPPQLPVKGSLGKSVWTNPPGHVRSVVYSPLRACLFSSSCASLLSVSARTRMFLRRGLCWLMPLLQEHKRKHWAKTQRPGFSFGSDSNYLCDWGQVSSLPSSSPFLSENERTGPPMDLSSSSRSLHANTSWTLGEAEGLRA